jgi:hypothetical protein
VEWRDKYGTDETTTVAAQGAERKHRRKTDMNDETKTNPTTLSRRRVLKAGAVTSGALLIGGTGVAAAYDFPSTNENNEANGWPYVDEDDDANCEVTLEFVNDTNSLAYFEYRIDGEVPEETYGPHPVISGDVIYPGVTVDGRGESDPVVETRTFNATSMVEIRLALGGERDWDFDWTPFTVPSCDPETKNDCKDGGWEAYGFRNQGQCIRYVNTGKDSR